MTGTRLCVAAVQMRSEAGAVQANLARALPLVEEAASAGARLILLPELMPGGYVFSPAIWDGAEPAQGLTVRWLKEHGRRLSVYLGTSFLEAEGEDFFNTFVLATPDGQEAGRVRKQTPALFETCFTTGSEGPHTLETALGRIGVGICYENQQLWFARLMGSRSIDLLLMPHSAPMPRATLFSRRKIRVLSENLSTLAPHYAQLLGVPAVFCNKCGPFESPLPGWPFTPRPSSFPGLSTIADSDGAVRAQLGAEEGVILAEVSLDPRRKKTPSLRRGHWLRKMPWGTSLFCGLVEAAGRSRYRRSTARRERARAASSSSARSPLPDHHTTHLRGSP